MFIPKKGGSSEEAVRREAERQDRIREEIGRMFQRRAAARYLWHDRWNRWDGYEPEAVRP